MIWLTEAITYIHTMYLCVCVCVLYVRRRMCLCIVQQFIRFHSSLFVQHNDSVLCGEVVCFAHFACCFRFSVSLFLYHYSLSLSLSISHIRLYMFVFFWMPLNSKSNICWCFSSVWILKRCWSLSAVISFALSFFRRCSFVRSFKLRSFRIGRVGIFRIENVRTTIIEF